MTIRRPILEPIGKLAMGALNAGDIAQTARLIVTREGCTLVSVDGDGEVYATPIEHPFSHAMLRQYSDCVVGTYAPNTTANDIRDDIAEHWKAVRKAVAA